MKRTSFAISLTETEIIGLHNHFSVSASLQGKETNQQFSILSSLHGFGAVEFQQLSSGTALQQLQQSVTTKKDWHFICLAYDLKNEIEDLTSENRDLLHFSDLVYFIPRFVLVEKEQSYELLCRKEDRPLFDEQLRLLSKEEKKLTTKLELQPQLTKKQYTKKFNQIQKHIQQGNIYEINFCQQYIQENIQLSPALLFRKILNRIQAPYMAFFQANNHYLLSASPERYLLKRGNLLLSQPIKGTAKRGNNKESDQQIKHELKTDLKEQTENVMIVDLVRNDLGKCCIPGSVKVVELQQLYSFSTVHQLISTIQGTIRPDISFSEILRNTFPMGSMTGAPKLRVMQLIEEIEEFKRSWYSGAVGYINPDGDFDFNVIIRSFLYDKTKQLLSYGVGSGITSFSKAENEYEECLLKVNSLLQLLNERQ